MAASIKNVSGVGITLPSPFRGIVGPGEAVLVEGTAAEVLAALGPVPNGTLKVSDLSTGGAVDTFRSGTYSSTVEAQSAWYIDPTNGSDSGSGSAAHPLQTLSELATRWWDTHINDQRTVYILEDLPTTDAPRFRFSVGDDGFVLFKGVVTEIATGTLTAVTNRSPAGNQPNEVTDSGLSADWGTLGYVEKRLRLTSGTNTGAVAWVAKDLGSKQARVSSWMEDSEIDLSSLPWDPLAGNVEASATDGYVIEDLPVLHDISMDVTCSAEGAYSQTTRVAFEDLDINPSLDRTVMLRISGDRYSLCLNRCILGMVEPANGGTLPMVNCMSYVPALQNNVTVYVLGGFVRSYLNCGCSSEVAVGGAVLINGGFWVYGGKIYQTTGGVCVMETGSYNGVDLQVGAVYAGGSQVVFGDADTGLGVNVSSGSKMLYGSSKPTLTGTAGDSSVGGTAKAWTAIPYFEPTNGAALVA